MKVIVKTIQDNLKRKAADLGWKVNDEQQLHVICLIIHNDGLIKACVELFEKRAILTDLKNLKIVNHHIDKDWFYFEHETSGGLFRVLGPNKLRDYDVFFEMLDDFIIP